MSEATPITIDGRQIIPILIEGNLALKATDAAKYVGLSPKAFLQKRKAWGLKGFQQRSDTRSLYFLIKDLDKYRGFEPEA